MCSVLVYQRQLFRYLSVALLIPFLIVFTPNCCIAQKCILGMPTMGIDENALEKLSHSTFMNKEYKVKRGIKEFRLNCSQMEPIFWKVNLVKEYRSAQIEYFTEPVLSGERQHQNDPQICHTASILFKDVTENITGEYACSFASVGPSILAPIFIFGGTSSENGTQETNLISRGKHFLVEMTDKVYDSIPNPSTAYPYLFYDNILNDDYKLKVPCIPNAYSDIKAVLRSYATNGTMGNIIGTVFPTRCGSTMCIDFSQVKSNKSTEQLIRNGLQIECSLNNGDRNPENNVFMDVLPTPDTAFNPPPPKHRMLYVVRSQLLHFICRSIYPIRINSDYEFAKSIVTTADFNRYYMYKSVLEIIIPDYTLAWEKINLIVSCENPNNLTTLFSWNYTIVNSEILLTSNNSHLYTRETVSFKFEDQVGSLKNGYCQSLNAASVNVYLVPCTSVTQCKMVANLLYGNEEAYRLPISLHRQNTATFEFPNDTFSGMVRCVGFQIDVMTLYYKYFQSKRSEYKIKYLSTPEPVYSLQDYKFPVLSSNISVLFEGDVIYVSCSLPLMLMASQPYLTFVCSNQSEPIILPDNIISSAVTKDKGMIIISSEIKVPDIHVIGVSCITQQYIYVAPFIWKEGSGNNDAGIIANEKKEYIPITVKAKPITLPVYTNTATIVGSVFGTLFLLSIMLILLFINRQRKLVKEFERMREEDLEFFMKGRPDLISENEFANANVEYVAYDETKEIDMNLLRIDYKTQLGAGNFGIVYKGLLIWEDKTMTVAVKMLKSCSTLATVKSAMTELKVMMFVQSHKNVIKIIGEKFTKPYNNELFVIMEHCGGGNLLNFLQRNSQNFINLVKKGKISQKEKMRDITVTRSKTSFNTTHLISWAAQISNGMRHIANLKVIHGDLAARNLLLDSTYNVKISDFGLSKKLYELNQYVSKNTIPLPWKWLAVETLRFTEFSLASDVWAFGITVWEIFSLGESPYPGLEYNPQFVKMLTEGFRLPMPEFTTYEIYDIILECWRKVPSDRPTFDDLFTNFSLLLKESTEINKSELGNVESQSMPPELPDVAYVTMELLNAEESYLDLAVQDTIV